MRTIRALALIAVAMAASPAWAQDCPSAEVLEQRLLETPVEPFAALIEPPKPDQAWPLAATGGFLMAAPPLGEIQTFRHASVETSCGLRISWKSFWNSGGVTSPGQFSAGQFKVVQIEAKPAPRASQKYRASLFRVTPDKASQTAWLSITYGGQTSDYLLNFPATALSAGPITHHSDGVRLELMGVRADGALVYAAFGGREPR